LDHGIRIRNEADFKVRKSVFVLNRFAFVAVHTDELNLVVLLRNIPSLRSLVRRTMKNDQIAGKVFGALDRSAIEINSPDSLETPIVDLLRSSIE
jgi:hypothetical protein